MRLTMIETKTVAFSIVAIVGVMAVFAAAPFVVGHEAQAFIGSSRNGGFLPTQNDNSHGNDNNQASVGQKAYGNIPSENAQGNQN